MPLGFDCIRKGIQHLPPKARHGRAPVDVHGHVPRYGDIAKIAKARPRPLALEAAGLDHFLDLVVCQQTLPVVSNIGFRIVAKVIADTNGDAGVAGGCLGMNILALVFLAARNLKTDDCVARLIRN